MFCGFVYFRGWTISPKVRNPGFFIWLGGNEETMRRTHILDLRQRASDDGSAIGVPYSLGAGWSRSDFAVDEVNLSSG